MVFINMANSGNESNFSLTGFSKNVLVWIAAGFCYGFIAGLREDNSYHFAVIVGGHTVLPGLLAGSISYSIFNLNLLNFFPRLKYILGFSMYFGVFSLISSFIVNTSPYTNNTTIIDDIAIVSPISDFIFGAVGGCIFSFFITFKDHETT